MSIFFLPCFPFFLFVCHLACSLPQCSFFLIWSPLFPLHTSTVSSKTQNVNPKLSLKTTIFKCLWYPATSHKKRGRHCLRCRSKVRNTDSGKFVLVYRKQFWGKVIAFYKKENKSSRSSFWGTTFQWNTFSTFTILSCFQISLMFKK